MKRIALLLQAGFVLATSLAAQTSVKTSGPIETAGQLKSTVATGTAPLAVSSTTTVENLSSDLLDGLESSAFAASADLEDLETAVANQRGVVFTRWGRSDCPAPTSLVYSGFAGGKNSQHTGSGANTLCLSSTPTWDGFSAADENGAVLYGVEYQINLNGLAEVAPFDELHDDDAPCAVCLDTEADIQLMIPGTQVCPTGWTSRVEGYLMAPHYLLNSSEFVCVDKNAEASGSAASEDGLLWYSTEVECGPLPCDVGQYIQDRELTCAICTR